ncbi:hypothetical protein [Priestia flexa]|uniref:Uncharacterized protein n=1 Tax=Priestia flexa TaxID=86664 RepID=A0ABU4J255_9BACI|nr:hypothetical protein [Priestia flexa]MDW8515075.1 hypothetical protein [Priestia flexa]
MKVNLEHAQVTVLLEINGQMHLVAMDKEKFDAINMLVKSSTEMAVPTGESQSDLNKFLGY